MTRAIVKDLVASSVLRVEDGNHGNDRPRPHEFIDDGVAFIRAADMSSGVVDFDGAGKINDVAVRRIRKGVGRPGDVILSHKGTVGRVAVAPLTAPPFVCSPQTTFWRSLDRAVLDQRYLRYLLMSFDFQRQLSVLSGQTDMAPYVSLTDQRSIEIEMPAIADQRAIVEVLGALDDKIAANERVVSLTDSIAEALTRRSASGEVVALSEIASVTMGSSPPGTSYNEAGEGLPFYQGVRDFGARFPVRRVWTVSPVRRASAGDTLLSVRAPVGRTNFAAEDICIGRGLAALQSNGNMPMTLFHQVRAAHAAWAPFEAEGTVFGSINRAQLASIEVPVIDASNAEALENRLLELEELIASALRENTTLAATRDDLLPLLMSGEICVKDAEDAVEEVL